MWKTICMYTNVIFQYVMYRVRTTMMHRNVRHVHKNHYDVHYRIHDRHFILRTSVRRGPCRLVSIRNRKGEEVGSVVRPYLGPNEDCHHHQSITPADIGFQDGLYFFFRGRVGTFVRGKETIQVDQMYRRCMMKK